MAPAARGLVIRTRIDARLYPAKYPGRSEGDPHKISKAGGRADDDTIGSSAISYRLHSTSECACFIARLCYRYSATKSRELCSRKVSGPQLGPAAFVASKAAQDWPQL